MSGDPTAQVATAAACAAVVATVLVIMSSPGRWSSPRMAERLLVGAAAMVAVGLLLTAQWVHLTSEIDPGRYALIQLSVPQDPRLAAPVRSAMSDGRITYAEYETMGFKGAIPDLAVMREVVATEHGPATDPRP